MTQLGENMVPQSCRALWRIVILVGLVSIAGCACMGGGELLDRLARSRTDQSEMGEGMCGGMMRHGATKEHASSQPTHLNEKNSHGLN